MNEQSVFIAALEHAPADRARFLDQACENQHGFRQRVERLIASHEAAISFMDVPAGQLAKTVDQPLPETCGVLIGPYKLLQEIGQGGMGVVYMAEQVEPVRRKVALKIIKPGMDTRQVIARFEAERQALSLMDHPNIARVLDAGTTDTGRPYFVMELVKGQPITAYCNQQHLTPRQRLELFVPVCQAIQHAHQKGIIHRDVKPSNVLVAEYDGRPVAKVIDFGVAKAVSQPLTEKTMFTGIGQVVGTLEYMSPEQARVNQFDVDTRSDIYSLGVLLYELLTGTTPIEKKRLRSAAWDEMLRMIREEEPPKPSTRLSDSKDSLASISAQRQTEPAKLTRLVRGELDWIVMKALEKDRSRRYETALGFAADVQRYLADESVQACPPSAAYRFRKFARRNKRGMVVAGLLLLLLVLGGGGLGWVVRDRANRQITAARQVDAILAEVDRLEAERKWRDALAAARRSEAAVNGGGADDVTEQRVRERLTELEFVERLEKIRITWALTQVEWDREYSQAFLDFGVDVDELPVESAAERLGKRPALAVAFASALDSWVIHRQALPAGGDAGWKRLVAVARGIDPDPLRDRLRAMLGQPVLKVREEVRQLVESIEVGKHPPETITALLDLLRQVDLRVAAVRVLREAQILQPRDFWINYNLAYELDLQGNHTEAARFASVALSIRPDEWPVYHLLGICLSGQGKLNEAIAIFHKAIDIIPKGRTDGVHPRHNLGHTLRAQGNSDEAAAVFREVVELDPSNPRHRLDLGHELRTLGKQAEADASFGKAVELARQALERNPTSSEAWVRLGQGLRELRQPDEAITAFRTAIQHNTCDAGAYLELGGVLKAQGRTDDLLEMYRKASEQDQRNADVYLWNLALYLQELGKSEEAMDVFGRILQLRPRDAEAYERLGQAYSAQGKLDEAIEAYCRAIEIDPDSFKSFNNLGVALGRKGMLGESADALALAAGTDPKQMVVYANLGSTLFGQQKWAEAIAAYGRVIGLDPTSVVGHRYRGAAYAALGRWTKAATDYERWCELDGKEHEAWRQAAYAHMAAGNAEGYRRVCRGLIERFGQSDDPVIAERTAKLGSLVPGAVADFRTIEKQAERAVTGTEKHGFYRYFVLTKGLTESRAGRDAAAVPLIMRFEPSADGGDCDAVAFAALAISQQRLGRSEEARDALAKVKAMIATKMPDPANGRPFVGNWTDWVHAQVLTREAEELMRDDENSNKPREESNPK